MNYLIAFIAGLLVTPVIRSIAVRFNIIDKPQGDALKIHREPVALLGGSAVLISLIIGMFFGLLKINYPDPRVFIWILFIGTIVASVGLWDDVKNVYPGFRLLVHSAAALIIFSINIKLPFNAAWISGIITVCIIAGSINAYNMIDGMDGLCAGLTILSCVGFYSIGLGQGNAVIQMIAGSLGMVLLGFLPYNFYKAKIFLGDAGSGLLGFLMGILAILSLSKTSFLTVCMIVCVVGLPLFDMVWAVVRRIIRRKPLFKGDRDHIYDLLLKKGLSQKKVWAILCGLQAVCVGLALCFQYVL